MYSWEKKLLRPKPAVSSIPSRTHKAYSTVQKMGTNGRSSCLECSGDITEARRKTFCCKSCSDNFYIKTRPDFARHEVFKRDKGVCAKCGLDVYAGLPEGRKRSRGTGHLWHADHILPVAEGGGSCGLDNLRTLCVPCHNAETAALRKRLAAARVHTG